MNPIALERLFGWRHGFDHPVTRVLMGAAAAAILLGWALTEILRLTKKIPEKKHKELRSRIGSWAIMLPLLAGPVLLGAAWTILAISLLSLFCFREFSRATGLFRHYRICLVAVIGILLLSFATFDHWYGFFVALPALVIALMAAVALLADEPRGYIQRIALGILGFLFFGVFLGHLGFMANDTNYRPIILMTIFAVELNDVFAYLCGSLFGRHKLCPNTSPNKTVEGAVGAVILTTALAATLGHFVFAGTSIDMPIRLIPLGILISVAGQMGDLMLSSVKRDLGIKDLNALIPGHGGLLDRFDSLVLAAPVVFHYVGYFNGFGVDQPTRIIATAIMGWLNG